MLKKSWSAGFVNFACETHRKHTSVFRNNGNGNSYVAFSIYIYSKVLYKQSTHGWGRASVYSFEDKGVE